MIMAENGRKFSMAGQPDEQGVRLVSVLYVGSVGAMEASSAGGKHDQNCARWRSF